MLDANLVYDNLIGFSLQPVRRVNICLLFSTTESTDKFHLQILASVVDLPDSI